MACLWNSTFTKITDMPHMTKEGLDKAYVPLLEADIRKIMLDSL